MKTGVLELVASFVDANFELPKPITVISKAYDEIDAYWDPEGRQLVLCYELVAEFVELRLRAPQREERPAGGGSD